MVDGEATAQQLMELRPHLRNCPGCRATLRTLQDSTQPLQAVFPIPLAVAALGTGDHVANLFTRAYEIVVGGLHDRAVTSFTKAHAVVEATAAGKATAIAGAAAAVAGGGYATVERSMVEARVERPAKVERVSEKPRRPVKEAASRPVAPSAAPDTQAASRTLARERRGEFAPIDTSRTHDVAPEFGSKQMRLRAQAAVDPGVPAETPRPTIVRSPEFASPSSQSTAPEFGP